MRAEDAHLLWWNLHGPGAERMRRQLDLIGRELDPFPDVLAFAEVLASSLTALRDELPDYTVIAPDGDLPAKKRRSVLAVRGQAEALAAVDRFTIPASHHVAAARRFRVWPRAIVSACTELVGQPVEVHAVHIPNGSSNGWIKIDHLWALRYGLERSELPQIICSDLNTPRAERNGQVITFGQELDGSFSEQMKIDALYPAERPWEARPWDEGERAVLEGLPRELNMPDTFRELHPDEPGFTWGPRGGPPDRRLDHVFVSRRLTVTRCEHLDAWREHNLSDHCPIAITVQGPRQS